MKKAIGILVLVMAVCRDEVISMAILAILSVLGLFALAKVCADRGIKF